MSVTTVNSKGQITIPGSIRTFLNLKAGDKVQFFVDDRDLMNLVPVTKHISTLKGIVNKPESTVSIGDMNAAIKKISN
jgi:antitoxin PrlF